MSDVTIPAETARDIAAALRGRVGSVSDETAAAWADALDPKPTLRDAVAEAIRASDDEGFDPSRDYADDYRRNADAALAVVRDHIAAMPVPRDLFPDGYRNAVLALFDGAES